MFFNQSRDREASVDEINDISRPVSAVSIEQDVSVSDSSGSYVSWITWHCSLPGNEYLLQIPEFWIEDSFNLTGLQFQVPMYTAALEMILDLEPEDPTEEEENTPSRTLLIETSAQTLYALIHQRFIMTKSGLNVYKQRYLEGEFGICPRVGCGGCFLIPCGLSDSHGVSTVKMYCHRCNDCYMPKGRLANLDGSNFGTSFAAALFVTYPELKAGKNRKIINSTEWQAYEQYTPKIYGFNISPLAPVPPTMKWLRSKPE